MPPPESAAPSAGTDKGIAIAYLYVIVLIASLGGFLFGYDLSLISGAIIFLKAEFALNPFWLGVVMGSAILGCPFGSLAGVWLADAVGRKRTLVLSGVLFIGSAIGCALAERMVGLIIWRFIGGMGVGLSSTVSPMLIAEFSPARLRGRMVMVFQLAVGIGLLLSVFVTYLLSFGGHWRWMFATQALPVFGLVIGLFFVPESPRWLSAVGRVKEALGILARINGQTQAEKEIKEIQEELSEESGGFRELFRPGVRLALITGITLMVFSQINGVNMIALYTPTIFLASGITSTPDAILNSVYLDCTVIPVTLTAIWLIHRFLRRSILIVGTIGMAVGHLLMFLAFTFHFSPFFTLAAMLLPCVSCGLSLAALSWVVISELFPNRVRAKAMCIATCAMFASSYITVNLFPMILDWFTKRYGQPGGTFLIFMVVCLACSFFVWRMLPETKDKTLEEMSKFWLKPDGRSENGVRPPEVS